MGDGVEAFGDYTISDVGLSSSNWAQLKNIGVQVRFVRAAEGGRGQGGKQPVPLSPPPLTIPAPTPWHTQTHARTQPHWGPTGGAHPGMHRAADVCVQPAQVGAAVAPPAHEPLHSSRHPAGKCVWLTAWGTCD